MTDLCNRDATPSPTSINSGGTGSIEESELNLPSSLATQELVLALNKEATFDELKVAVQQCRQLVLESEQCSVERKWLVRHLIELRLRMQECREAMDDPSHPYNKSGGSFKRTVRGHHLNLQPLLRNATSRYCDHCTGIIWSVVQAWYECDDCGYACHHKCITSIVRDCAHVIVSERGTYQLEICPELGLSHQKYMCTECKSPLAVNREWTEGLLCDYSGLYYCSACHWGSLAVNPARVVHNWDFAPYSVCQASLQELRVTSNRPLINLEKLNPKLFTLVQNLNFVKRLRTDLISMRKYLLVCRVAQEDHFLWKNVSRPHLIESTDMYSLQDLIDVQSGDLLNLLHTLVEVFGQHIKQDCVLCKARGHICEICMNKEVLYPFDDIAEICAECNAVFHKHCFQRKGTCVRCMRIQTRKSLEAVEIL